MSSILSVGVRYNKKCIGILAVVVWSLRINSGKVAKCDTPASEPQVELHLMGPKKLKEK